MGESTDKFKAWKKRWERPNEMDTWDYISFNFHPEDILIIGNLLFPKFIKVESCIFLAINFRQDVYEKMKMKYSSQYIEKNINRVNIYDLFAHCTDEVNDSVFQSVGELLQYSWKSHLLFMFPGEEVNVDYVNDDKDYGPKLIVYQKNELPRINM